MRPILIADSRALSTPSSCATKFSCTGGMFFFYAKEVIFIRELLIDLGFIIDAASVIKCDSKSAVGMAFDPVAFKKTKHILRHAYELRDRVARQVYAPQFVPTDEQLADVLTKGLRVAQHRALLPRLLHHAPPAAVVAEGATDGGTTR